VGFCFALIFFFVPETFWDRTPRARSSRARSRSPGKHHRLHVPSFSSKNKRTNGHQQLSKDADPLTFQPLPEHHERPPRLARVEFAERDTSPPRRPVASPAGIPTPDSATSRHDYFSSPVKRDTVNNNSSNAPKLGDTDALHPRMDLEKQSVTTPDSQTLVSGDAQSLNDPDQLSTDHISIHYTGFWKAAPKKSYVQTLKPWNGRLAKDKW
jgi:hypothetical protein